MLTKKFPIHKSTTWYKDCTVSKRYHIAVHLATNTTREWSVSISNVPARRSKLDKYLETILLLALNIVLFCLEGLLPMITVYLIKILMLYNYL